MDKKKVKELITYSILQIDRIVMGDIDGFEASVDVKRMLNEALEELSKSDWVSVKDGLPPYNARVLVHCGNTGLETIEVRHNYLKCAYSKFLDRNGFLERYSVTHWKPIEKLEE